MTGGEKTEEKPGGSKLVTENVGSKLIGTLENFVPSADFEDYLERAENFFELNNIKDNAFKRKLIVHFIGLPALKKLQQLLYPQTHKDVTYEVVINKLKTYFSPKKNIVAESVEFYKRRQLDFEKVADFAIELQSMAKHCEMGDYLDKGLRNKFIAGLHSVKIQGELMNCSTDTTFEQAVTKAKNLEMIEADMLKMREKQNFANRIDAGNFARRGRSQNRNQNPGNRKPSSAGRSQQGRSQSKGGNRSRKGGQRKHDFRCFRCGKQGHFARSCWSKQNGVSSDDESVVSEAAINHVESNHPVYRKL